MISEKAKNFCKEDISLIENYSQAVADTNEIWECHHRDEIRVLPSGMVAIRSRQELIENGRYYDCPANELIFLTKAEHTKLHSKNRNEETMIKFKQRKPPIKDKPYSEFGIKYKEHYGCTSFNRTHYLVEYNWYKRHNKKCRWE